MKTKSYNTIPVPELIAFDRSHIWHPYTSMTDPLPVYAVAKAAGVKLTLTDGRELIDGMSSWWTAIHGYNHPVLNEAAKTQMELMSHVMFGGLTHEPAVKLASLLIRLTPEPLQKVFFCDSGSVAVEVAVKMALQYWHALGKAEKNRLITVRSGYHGDTFQAMSLCDPIDGMHSLFAGTLPEHYFADAPKCPFGGQWDDADIESFGRLMRDHNGSIAAAILEPVVQGAGGMRIYSAEYVRQVRYLCDRYDVLLILDEIATGFGRTGKLFACEHAGISPDIMCVGKALTGGYVSLAATLATEQISTVISRGTPGLFMHGPTFMANPLACAIAVASIELLLEMPWENMIQAIETQLRAELEPCRGLPHIKDIRVLGAIGVIETDRPVDMARATAFFIERGVWIRPFSNIIYLMPPYIIQKNELSCLTGAIVEAAQLGAWLA